MTASYKIAIAAAVVICVVLIGVFVTSRSGPSSANDGPAGAPSAGTTPPASAAGDARRPTNSTNARTPTATTSADSTKNPQGVSDLMSRVKTHLDTNSAAPAKADGDLPPIAFVPPTASTDPAATTPPPSATTAPAATGSEVIEQPVEPRTLTFDGTRTTSPIGGTGTAASPTTGATTPSATTFVPPRVETPRTTAPEPARTTTTTPPASASRSGRPEKYTIEPGDTLSSISLRYYGSERMWIDIAQANPTIDPIRLRPGQEIRLPEPNAATIANRSTPPPPGQLATYLVRSGDNLSSIARQFYGDATLWRVIFNANRNELGNNPDRLQAGMKLTIPPKPPTSGN